MSLTTTRVLNTLRCDIDGCGQQEDVEIVEHPTLHYPLLARWTKPSKTGARSRTVWAIASHFLVKAPPEELAAARAAADARLSTELLQFRTLVRPEDPAAAEASGRRLGRFRVGPTPSIPDFRRAGEPGEVLNTLVAMRDAGVGAEPDYLYFVDAEPRDPAFEAHQQETMARIRAQKAWDVHTGSRGVVVAVVDTGIDYRHPDLQANIIGAEGGSVGWDFLRGVPDADDDHWHGTYCAGLIGAVGNNRTGMAGVNWKVSLLPLKAFSKDGIGTSTHAAAAIRFAVEKKADVILCAWGSAGESDEVRSAIEYADREGVLVVAAAGNSAVELDDVPHFPASFASTKLPNLISVSATDPKDEPLKNAGKSQEQVHLSAPGVDIHSTFPTRLQPYVPYHVSGGTSPAAALVAGGCALLKAYAKTRRLQRSHHDIRDALLAGVDKIEALKEISVSGGRLNLEQSMEELGRQKRTAARRRSTPAPEPAFPSGPPPMQPPTAPEHVHA